MNMPHRKLFLALSLLGLSLPVAGNSAVSAVATNSLFFNVNASDPSSYSASNPGTWTDLSAAGRNGAIQETATKKITYNGTTGALEFPGDADAYVDMGSGFKDFGNGITIEFEGHFGSSNQGWERIFDFGNGDAKDNIWVGVFGDDANDLAIELWHGELISGGVSRGRCVTTNDALLTNVSGSLRADVFAKYAITMDGTTCRIYKNGVEQNTKVGNWSSGYVDSASDLGSAYGYLPSNVTRTRNYIGKSNWSDDPAFNGAIKYVRIYTSALSTSDVSNNATTYTLTYATTGFTSGTAPAVKTGNGLISLSANTGNLAKTGHTFAGWAASSGQTTALANTYNLTADTTLHPVWIPNTYNVTYEEHGGSTVPDGSFTHGGSLTYPANPSLNGYVFQGWFSAATGGTPLTASAVAAGNASVTLHAQWSLPTAQVVTWAPTNTSLLTSQSPATPSQLATTDGGGAISYSVISAGTTGCAVNSSTAVLTFSGVGSCTVRATAAATTSYLAGSTDVIFNVSSSSPAISLKLGAASGDVVANSLVEFGAAGLKQNSSWTLVVQSTPQTLSSGTFSNAVVSGSAHIPTGLANGWHSVTFTGLTPNGATISHAVWFEVSNAGTLLQTTSTDPNPPAPSTPNPATSDPTTQAPANTPATTPTATSPTASSPTTSGTQTSGAASNSSATGSGSKTITNSESKVNNSETANDEAATLNMPQAGSRTTMPTLISMLLMMSGVTLLLLRRRLITE